MQPFGYLSFQYDDVSETYFAEAREYQSEEGRFSAQDIIVGYIDVPCSTNKYSYCFNNPMILVDWDGAWPQWIEDIGNGIKDKVEFIGNAAQEFWNSNIYGEDVILYKQDMYGNTYEVKEHTGGNIFVNSYTVTEANGKKVRNFNGWSVPSILKVMFHGHLPMKQI